MRGMREILGKALDDLRPHIPGDTGGDRRGQECTHGQDGILTDGPLDQRLEQLVAVDGVHGYLGFFLRMAFTRSISLRAAALNVSSMPERSRICLYIVNA